MPLNKHWPSLWASEDVLLREARRISYLVNVTNDGKLACKACGGFVPWENPEDHFQRHMDELDAYLGIKKRAASEFHASKRQAKREYAGMSEVLDGALLAELGIESDDEDDEAAIMKELGL